MRGVRKADPSKIRTYEDLNNASLWTWYPIPNPQIQKRVFRGVEGKSLILRDAWAYISASGTIYMLVVVHDVYRKQLRWISETWFRLDTDVFGLITARQCTTPIESIRASHWYDIRQYLPAFLLWHRRQFLPVMREKDGYVRVWARCHYFGPRGIDNPCDELERVNTYSTSKRAQRDRNNSIRYHAKKAGLTIGNII